MRFKTYLNNIFHIFLDKICNLNSGVNVIIYSLNIGNVKTKVHIARILKVQQRPKTIKCDIHVFR